MNCLARTSSQDSTARRVLVLWALGLWMLVAILFALPVRADDSAVHKPCDASDCDICSLNRPTNQAEPVSTEPGNRNAPPRDAGAAQGNPLEGNPVDGNPPNGNPVDEFLSSHANANSEQDGESNGTGSNETESPGLTGFPRYPYENGHDGFFLEEADCETLDDLKFGDFFLRSRVNWGSDFEGKERLSANLHYEWLDGHGVDASWSRYFVDRSKVPGVRDYQVGDLNFIHRSSNKSGYSDWSGIGINWYDESQPRFGYNITFGADYCLGDPWLVSSQLDIGEISHSLFFHYQITLGATWSGVEVYTGFDYFDFRTHQDPMFLAGIRAWF